jgi:hypothetical protein
LAKRARYRKIFYIIDRVTYYFAKYYNFWMFFLRLPLAVLRILYFVLHQLVYIPFMFVKFLIITIQLIVYSVYYNILRVLNYKTSYVIFLYKQTGFLYFLGRFVWSCMFVFASVAILIFYVGFFYPFVAPFILYYLYGSAPFALTILLCIWMPLLFLATLFEYGERFIMILNYFCLHIMFFVIKQLCII